MSWPWAGADFYADEAPVHRVRIDAFEIDRYPVTNAEFDLQGAVVTGLALVERPIPRRSLIGDRRLAR